MLPENAHERGYGAYAPTLALVCICTEPRHLAGSLLFYDATTAISLANRWLLTSLHKAKSI